MSKTSAGIREKFRIDISGVRVFGNSCLLKVDVVPDDGHVLDSGIIVGGSRWDEAGHVARYGEVIQMPKELKCRDKYSFPEAIWWGTSNELQIGDIAYFGKMASANSPALIDGDMLYYVINYDEIILAKRGEDVIPLNGYCIVEKFIEGYSVNGLIVDFADKHNKRLGKVVYNGSNNTFYQGTKAKDASVEVGDTVVFQGNYWTELENSVFATLDENLGYVQKNWIIGKI